jgi:two-component system sensor histidine kinase TctE|tara:strand:+ start:124475 stop:125839 length:1365 start_codon:yes stop_codon:yes gene_type:complete
MEKNTQSISYRLVIWLTIPLIIFSILLFCVIYFFVNEKVNKFYDNNLYATGKSMEDSIGIRDGHLLVDLPYFAIDLLSSNNEGSVFYSIIDEKDKLLVGYKGLVNKDILGKKDKVFYNTSFAAAQLRAVSFNITIKNFGKKHKAIITVAETLEGRISAINDILIVLLILMGVVIISTLVISLIAVRKGLRPLYNLQKIIKKRDLKDLSPIKFNAPKEIEEVLNSINILLERSRDNIKYIEHFNSDVSHQLRTPLAELKVKIELLYKKDEKEYITFMKLVDSMSHITEQLLLYAKTNPNSININRFKKINLTQMCKDYCLKTAPRVYAKGFEFAYESFDKDIFINADSILLESMLDNIISNALYYAVDEKNNPMGTISVNIKRHNNTIWLNVKDEGYGLNTKDLNHIFDRFYRVDSNKKGNGLGLSIVKQIAQLHNATVQASNDEGLVISIIFPL